MATIIPINEPPKPLVKADVVARYLGFSERYIVLQAAAGKIPAKRFGNGRRSYWRFNLEEVVNALEQNSAQAG